MTRLPPYTGLPAAAVEPLFELELDDPHPAAITISTASPARTAPAAGRPRERSRGTGMPAGANGLRRLMVTPPSRCGGSRGPAHGRSIWDPILSVSPCENRGNS